MLVLPSLLQKHGISTLRSRERTTTTPSSLLVSRCDFAPPAARLTVSASTLLSVWAAWAGILFIFFGLIAIHTLLRVRAQVLIAARKKERLVKFSAERTFYLFSSRPNHPDPSAVGQPSNPHSNVSSTAARSSPRTQSDGDAETFEAPGNGQSVAFAADAAPKVSEMPPELMHVAQTETTSVLFPALKIKPGEKLTKVQAATRRSEALSLVYRNLIIQYAAIGLGVLSFGFDAGYIAISTYTTARVNNIGIFQEVSFRCFNEVG